jgi:LPXTG-motif cell wall-anchored protein
MKNTRGRLIGLVAATGLLAAVFLGFGLSSGSAGAAGGCDISRFTGSGGVDVTGYLQCEGPSLSEGSVAPGGTVQFLGGGFASGSSFEIVLQPGSIPLGTFQAGPSGLFNASVVIPSDTAVGSYRLVAIGLDPDGDRLNVEQTLEVSTSTSKLPSTGSNTTLLVGVGMALTLVGGASVSAARRSRASSQA